MENEEFISLNSFCIQYQVNELTVLSLKDFGLNGLKNVNKEYFLHTKDIKLLERILRLHCDLGINLEGVDAIVALLEQIKLLQYRLWLAENKLSFFSEH